MTIVCGIAVSKVRTFCWKLEKSETENSSSASFCVFFFHVNATSFSSTADKLQRVIVSIESNSLFLSYFSHLKDKDYTAFIMSSELNEQQNATVGMTVGVIEVRNWLWGTRKILPRSFGGRERSNNAEVSSII